MILWLQQFIRAWNSMSETRKFIAIILYVIATSLILNPIAKSHWAQTTHIFDTPLDHEWDWCAHRPGGC